MSSPSPLVPPHKTFALVGRSRALDPTRHAVRGDLADVRLADQVFAPHYAAPLPRSVVAAAPLRAARTPDSDVLVSLVPGDTFELLDVTGDLAWGVAPVSGFVGYVKADVLGPAAADAATLGDAA